MKRSFITVLIFLACLFRGFCQEYEYKVFESSEGEKLNYRLLTPENAKQSKKYPLVMFLHGAGERGEDNEKQLIHGSQMFLNPTVREKHPAFILFPQCPSNLYWAFLERPESFDNLQMGGEMPPILQTVKEMLDTYLADPMVDKDRIYIMGLSMGGMGTFSLVSRYPEIFAAAIPICGIADLSVLPAAKDVKFRIYHGDADTVVSVKHSREAYRTLKKSGAKVEYFEFPGCGHGSWNPAFNQPDFFNWLFKQKR